jgi:hypothetical protein
MTNPLVLAPPAARAYAKFYSFATSRQEVGAVRRPRPECQSRIRSRAVEGGVAPRAAVARIGPGAPVEVVVAVLAEEVVGFGASGKVIRPGTTQEIVRPGLSDEEVGSGSGGGAYRRRSGR